MNSNPSLRGFLFGYVAEYQLRKRLLADSRVSEIVKYDDHDRRSKGDLRVVYGEVPFTVELKSLQTRSVRQTAQGYSGNFQCDASDSRLILLPNGERLKTTCLLVGEFDIVAVNLFAFRGQWDFAFALNRDLPRTTYKGYTPEQQRYLLATAMAIHWPIAPPFTPDPFALLDQLIAEQAANAS